MIRSFTVALIGALALAAACVTINVYFPAAEAEKAADKVIDEVWGGKAAPAGHPTSSTMPLHPRTEIVLYTALNFVVPTAEAAPNLDISSPEISRLTASMEARFAQLKPLLDGGLLGLSASGDIAIRDPAAVPLAQRASLNALVAAENADRAELYRQIAIENGQPGWEKDVRRVFAERWIARAPAGWYVQAGGGTSWSRK